MTTAGFNRPPGAVTTTLVVLFLIGLYLGLAAQLPGGIPVPAAIAGAMGGLLFLGHISYVRERHLVVLVGVLTLYVLSILTAPDYGYLGERFKGFVQLTYSILIGYAVFLAVTRHDRRRLAAIFLTLSVLILIGCALENYTGLRAVSDAFRARFFESGVYIADLRDQIFYGLVRPKLFTSEPSAATFGFALFAFSWYALSQARGKLFAFLGLLATGYYLMRGPTLLLAAALIPAYEMLLASRRGLPGGRHVNFSRFAGAAAVAILLAALVVPFAVTFYAERLQAILSGQDPSFFSRVIAPPLVAFKIIEMHPATGAGLTSWEYIEEITQQIYSSAQWLSTDYRFKDAATAITNYFWLHWISLGLFWGIIILVALTMMLRVLGVPSILFCWAVWAVFGQGAGSYVGPQCWSVLFLAAAIAVVHERESTTRETLVALHAAYRGRTLRTRREPYLSTSQIAGRAR